MKEGVQDESPARAGDQRYRQDTLRRIRRNGRGPVLLWDVPVPRPARTASRVRHELALVSTIEDAGLVRPIEVTTTDDTLQLVMENADGEPLKAHLRRAAPSVARVLEIFVQIAATLDAIHQLGLMHGSFNAGSAWLEVSGKVKLVDVGLGTALVDAPLDVTDPRVVRDCLSYLPPEQTGRTGRRVDHRTDLYALGVVFFEALTGVTPFTDEDPLAMVHAHLARPPPSPVALLPDLPRPIADIVLKLLSKAPQDRYHSAAGLRFDIMRCHDALTRSAEVSPFVLGERDVPRDFQLPDALKAEWCERRTGQVPISGP